MHPSNIQAMIAVNAARITRTEVQIGYLLDQAKHYKQSGEPAFAVDAYNQADNRRNKLAKAVRLQHDLKIEIDQVHRTRRISSKVTKLATKGVIYVAHIDNTSFETEAQLDVLMAISFPPKPDSRIKM